MRKYEFERVGILPEVVNEAVRAARQSPCSKSRRGVVVFDPDLLDKLMVECPGNLDYRREWLIATGYNAPPEPMYCNEYEVATLADLGVSTGSTTSCLSHCGKLAVHAEANALVQLTCNRAAAQMTGFHMLHVAIDRDDEVMSCDGPSCWQCSKAILADGRIDRVWLYELVHVADDAGAMYGGDMRPRWRGYSALDFHCATLRHPKNNLPVATRA